MTRFNIGDKVCSIYEPDKMAVVISINEVTYLCPVYTVRFEDGNEYANYGSVFKFWVTFDDALRYGEMLTDDEIHCFPNGKEGWVRIRTICYESRIFYHKMVDGEVIEFKELTR